MTIPTPEDLEQAEADLARDMAAQEAETDPGWRAALAEMVEMEMAWIAEMRIALGMRVH